MSKVANFKTYLNEQEELVIDANVELAMSQLDKLNSDLDDVTEKEFMNSAIFMNAVRGTLERYGILLPQSYVTPMLSAEAETVYTLGDSGKYVYITHNLNGDGLVDGYAQIVDETELNDLVNMINFDEDEENDVVEVGGWVPPDRKTAAEDGGNNDEYT